MKTIAEWDQFHRARFAASRSDSEELATLAQELMEIDEPWVEPWSQMLSAQSLANNGKWDEWRAIADPIHDRLVELNDLWGIGWYASGRALEHISESHYGDAYEWTIKGLDIFQQRLWIFNFWRKGNDRRDYFLITKLCTKLVVCVARHSFADHHHVRTQIFSGQIRSLGIGRQLNFVLVAQCQA